MRPSGISYPLAISANGISLPHFSQNRLYLMRPPSSGCTWRKLMSFSSVAEKSFTGIVTRPKEIAPFHIERGMPPSLPDASDKFCGAARALQTPAAGDSSVRRSGLVSELGLQQVKLFGGKPQQVVAAQHCRHLGCDQRRGQALPGNSLPGQRRDLQRVWFVREKRPHLSPSQAANLNLPMRPT